MPTSKNATATYHSKLPIDIHCQNKPYSVAFTKNGAQVICGDNGRTLRRWRVNDGQEIGTPVKVGGRVYGIEASQDGRWIVLAEERMVVVRDSRTSAKVLEMGQHKGQVGAIDVSADSTKIASGSEDGATYVFSITTGKKLLGPLEHNADVIGVKFSPNGERIATATPILVRVWDAKTGEKLIAIPAVSVSYPVMPFAWSSDSRYLFAATPGWITCIDVSTSVNLDSWSFPSRDTKPPLLVSNGRFIACCTGISVYFLDISSRTQVGPIIKFPTTVRSIALSSDDSCLACGRVDNIISVYNLGDFLPQYVPLDPARCLPLMSISDAAFKSWIDCHLVDAEATLSKEITSSNPSHNVFANRALVQTRLRKWDTAIADAKESLAIQPSPIGHIAMALALVGQGQRKHALRAVDLAFRDCRSDENSYLLLIKAILSFVCGRRKDAILRVQDLMSNADDGVMQCCIQVLVNMYLERGDYESAVQTLDHGSPVAFSPGNSHLATISLVRL
ncbi:hypothetical protein EV363DRAFT_707046 [Boletus edulis]|nr:hypothetical protein EV363DRAFT_707046 [Boletus edulis]